MHPPVNWQVVAGRLEVLANRDDVGARCGLNVVENLEHLVVALTDPNHDARLRDKSRRFEDREHFETALVLSLWSHGGVHSANSLEVVADDFGTRVTHNLNRSAVTTEITNKYLNTHLRTGLMHSVNRLGPDRCATIWKFIPIHTRDDNMLQSKQFQTRSNTPRFIEIKQWWTPRLDITESARARARIAEDHDGGSATAPTLTHVWATGLLANRVQLVLIDDRLEPQITLAARHLRPQPLRLSSDAELLHTLSAILCTVVENLIAQTERSTAR